MEPLKMCFPHFFTAPMDHFVEFV